MGEQTPWTRCHEWKKAALVRGWVGWVPLCTHLLLLSSVEERTLLGHCAPSVEQEGCVLELWVLEVTCTVLLPLSIRDPSCWELELWLCFSG